MPHDDMIREMVERMVERMARQTVQIGFSGYSDDLICLQAPDSIVRTAPDGERCNLDEVSFLRWGGWVVTMPDEPPFRVQAHCGGGWSFSVRMGDGLDPEVEAAPFPSVPIMAGVTRHERVKYSTVLVLMVPPGTTVGLTKIGADGE